MIPDVLDENGSLVRKPGEEALLLQQAGPHLHVLIIGVEMGCRLGELLSIQWQDVRWKQDILLVHADNTKTAETRVPDLATAQGGAGHAEHRARRQGATAERLRVPQRGRRGGRGRLAGVAEHLPDDPGIQDLHLHDQRREFGSRLLTMPRFTSSATG